jgi:O-antigen ligase
LFEEQQVQLYTALILVMIMGIPFSLYRGLSFKIIFTEYINVILFFFIFFKVVDSVKKVEKILLIACLGSGLYSAFAFATQDYRHGRLYFGSMFDPNDLAFFAVSFLPLNLFFISRDRPKWVRMACLSSFAAGLMLILTSASRGGLLALVAVAALLLFSKSRVLSLKAKIVFSVFFMAILLTAPINLERYKTILEFKEDYNVWDETGRIGIWKIGMRAMLENPITGTGVGTFSEAVGRDRARRNTEVRTWQAPHNMAVQIGTETGMIGLALFLLMSLNVFRIFGKVHGNSATQGLIRMSEMGKVGFFGLFVSGMFLSQAYSFYWAFYVVLSAAVNRVYLKEKKSLLPKPRREIERLPRQIPSTLQ